MHNAQEIGDLISELAKKKGKTIKQALKESGLTHNVVDNMKRGSMPSADKLYIIARYFDVSTDFE